MNLVFTVLLCSLYALPVSGTEGCTTEYIIHSVLPSESVCHPDLVPWEDTETIESFRKIPLDQGAIRTDVCLPAKSIRGNHAFPGLSDHISRRDFPRPLRI